MSSIFTTFFYQPILNLLVFIYNIVPGHDLGIAIIVLTIVIKLVLLPLSKKSIESQKALQDLQPKMEEIKKKYADNKEAMGKAMMELYQNNKVNPFSSCLPLLIQLPFLWAVFRVFRSGINSDHLDLVYSFISRPEAINHMAFGVLDLSAPNTILAVLAGVSQFWVSKMLMAKKPPVKSAGSKDESMMTAMNKQMLYFMPAITVFIGLTLPGGLTLYWFITTILTGAQQMYLFNKVNKKDNSSSDNKIIEGEVVK